MRLFDFTSLHCQCIIKPVIEISSARVLVKEQRAFCFIKWPLKKSSSLHLLIVLFQYKVVKSNVLSIDGDSKNNISAGWITETVKILVAETYSGLLQCWCTSGFLVCSNNHNSLKPSSLFRSFQLILRLQPHDMTKDMARPTKEITRSFKLNPYSVTVTKGRGWNYAIGVWPEEIHLTTF